MSLNVYLKPAKNRFSRFNNESWKKGPYWSNDFVLFCPMFPHLLDLMKSRFDMCLESCYFPLSPGKVITLLNLTPAGQGCPMKHTTEGDILEQRRSVLIVDRSEETREVLQTALNRRGVRTFTASHAADGVELGQRHHPNLIVFDLEIGDGNLDDIMPPVWARPEDNNFHIILLGTLRRNCPQIPGSEFVSKPYHYGPLIRRIEEILGSE
jgi:CheY-like chemotaxis protein